MERIFVKSLRKIVREEGYDIFNDQDRFFSIMADYVGDNDPDNLNCLIYVVSRDILISLGNIFRNPRTAARIVPSLESKIQKSKVFSEETIVCFLRCFCDAFDWKNVTLNSEQSVIQKQAPAYIFEGIINRNDQLASQDLLVLSNKTSNGYGSGSGHGSASSAARKQLENASVDIRSSGEPGDAKPKSHSKLIFGSIVACLLVFFLAAHFWPSSKPDQISSNLTTDDMQYSDSTTADATLQMTEEATEYTEETNPGGFGSQSFVDAESENDTTGNEIVYSDAKPNVASTFRIDEWTEEDYSENLDPSEYYYYESEIGEFYFYYPAHLFNAVEMDESATQTAYGTNIRTICFYGSRGAELSYSVYNRTENFSISDITERIHQNEKNQYYEISDILVKSDDEKGRIVMSGVADSNHKYVVYDLIKVDANYVYRMLSLKPTYRTEEERVQYSYITENEYRMCGFSGSTKFARTYQEYLDNN